MATEKDIDYDALADEIASDDWEHAGRRFGPEDVAEVRAFELLRRECDAAITGAIRLSRHGGLSWCEIADAVGLDEADAIATYREAIGAEAEAAAERSAPGRSSDTKLIEASVWCRDDAAHRLAEAIERAKAQGVPEGFIESVVNRSEVDARYGWPYPSRVVTPVAPCSRW